MTKNIHEPIEESIAFTEEEKEQYSRKFMSLGIVLISLIILLFILIKGDYTNGIIISLNIFLIIFIAIFAIINLSHSRRDAFKQQFLVNEQGIFKTHINYTKGTESKEHIPFENIKKVIVNNFAAPYQKEKSNKIYYNLGAFMLIYHTEGSYYLYVYKEDQYNNFIDRFLDKNCPLYRSDKNLEQFFIQNDHDKLDFSQLPIERWDGKGETPTFEKGWDHDPYEVYQGK